MNKFLKTFALPFIIGTLLAIIVIQNFPNFFQGSDYKKPKIDFDNSQLELQPSSQTNSQNSQQNSATSQIINPQVSMVETYYPAVQKAIPAVVNIYTTKEVEQNPFMQDPFFRHFFGNQKNFSRKRLESSLGSGVILTQDGLVVTNEHVIKEAKEIKVALQDGREVFAKFIGSDSQTDIAVLKLDLENLPTLRLANSQNLRIGDVVLAIGNPFGIGQTVTQGIISALGRTGIGNNALEEFIQTDAAINPGNSGGALVNTKGELVGINTMIYSQSGGYQGIGFAIPSVLVKKVAEDLVTKGQVVRGWIGLEVEVVNEQIAQALGLTSYEGLLITGVWRNSPVQKAGILPGDLLLQIDGKKAEVVENVNRYIDDAPVGSELEITILRNSQEKTLKVKVVQKPSNLNE